MRPEIIIWLVFSVIVGVGTIGFVIWYILDTRHDRGYVADYIEMIMNSGVSKRGRYE